MPHQRVSRARWLAAIGAVGAAGMLGANGMRAQARDVQVRYSNAQWLKKLGPQRYHILREAGTEAPWSSKLEYEHRNGTYSCAGCDLALFDAKTKFESGTGWPSFYNHLPGAVTTRSDFSLIEERTEVLCRRCGGHLGHVFDDGPKPTGLRYCMNGLALLFHPR